MLEEGRQEAERKETTKRPKEKALLERSGKEETAKRPKEKALLKKRERAKKQEKCGMKKLYLLERSKQGKKQEEWTEARRNRKMEKLCWKG